MANGRILSKQISVSAQVNKLSTRAALLFTWSIAHADDWGRMKADPDTLRALVVPMRKEFTARVVQECLEEMEAAGLIRLYSVRGEEYLCFPHWEEHQSGLMRRRPSTIPGPDEECLEDDVEEWLVQCIESGAITFHGVRPIQIDRQLRIGNCYLDIVLRYESAPTTVIEVKRQRLSNAALPQIARYRELLDCPNATAVLFGHGIAVSFDLKEAMAHGVTVITYDDALRTVEHTSPAVMQRHDTLSDVIARHVTSSNVTQRQLTSSNVTQRYPTSDDVTQRYPTLSNVKSRDFSPLYPPLGREPKRNEENRIESKRNE